MCLAAAGLPLIASLLSTGVGVAGTVYTAQAGAAAATASEQQNRNNQIIAQRNAKDARDRGVVAEQDVQLRTRALLGKQKNILSERNLDVGSGSALEIIGDTASFGKLDALTTRQNAEREAISYEAQGSNFAAQADQDRMRARSSAFEGIIGGFSTALGGAQDAFKLAPKGTFSLTR